VNGVFIFLILWHTLCRLGSKMKARPQILVVDNDRNILAALRISLAAEGYRLIICCNADEAVKKVNRLRIDAVVTEIRLNGLAETGFAFLADLRHLLPRVPVIVISNQWDIELEERLKLLGINVFLPKPLELRSLKRTLKAMLVSATKRIPLPTKPLASNSGKRGKVKGQ
jgi:DNA-binding NtrC family response regulator